MKAVKGVQILRLGRLEAEVLYLYSLTRRTASGIPCGPEASAIIRCQWLWSLMAPPRAIFIMQYISFGSQPATST